MSIGENIRRLREERKITQEKLGEMVGVSFQAVSSWERDQFRPETDKLLALSEAFDVSLSSIVEDRKKMFHTKETIYDWEHMKTFVKTTARNFKMNETLRALDYAVEAHEGQKRKKSDIPYIYHPLNMACHALAMGIKEDDVIAACLLHDVVEDCGKTVGELPVRQEVKQMVRLLTRNKASQLDRKTQNEAYYGDIMKDPRAALLKCIDRCNNLTTMSWGLSRERIYRMIGETEEYYPALLDLIKTVPEYNDAAWLLKYQMESMLDIYKRLM